MGSSEYIGESSGPHEQCIIVSSCTFPFSIFQFQLVQKTKSFCRYGNLKFLSNNKKTSISKIKKKLNLLEPPYYILLFLKKKKINKKKQTKKPPKETKKLPKTFKISMKLSKN